MHKLRPREARGLGAAGRMADNENAKKPRRLAKEGGLYREAELETRQDPAKWNKGPPERGERVLARVPASQQVLRMGIGMPGFGSGLP